MTVHVEGVRLVTKTDRWVRETSKNTELVLIGIAELTLTEEEEWFTRSDILDWFLEGFRDRADGVVYSATDALVEDGCLDVDTDKPKSWRITDHGWTCLEAKRNRIPTRTDDND